MVWGSEPLVLSPNLYPPYSPLLVLARFKGQFEPFGRLKLTMNHMENSVPWKVHGETLWEENLNHCDSGIWALEDWEVSDIETLQGQLRKRSLASVKQNRFLSHFQFAQGFYLNTICRKKFHENMRRRLEKHLFS